MGAPLRTATLRPRRSQGCARLDDTARSGIAEPSPAHITPREGVAASRALGLRCQHAPEDLAHATTFCYLKVVEQARIVLNPDGTIADADDGALALYGASLGELRAAPRGAFTARPQPRDESDALRAAWESQGRPDLVGEATIRRLDGVEVRVSYGITTLDDGRLLAILSPQPAPAAQEPTVYTAGEVLARWRAAERELELVESDSPERSALERQIDVFRAAYQQVFRGTRGDSSPA